MKLSDVSMPIRVAALYRFTAFDDLPAIQSSLQTLCDGHGVRGTLILAGEGINGTIAGADAAIDAVLTHIRALPGCDALDVKFSRARAMPFGRMKVRIKREIVTMGQPDVDPLSPGDYVTPDAWNALIDDPDTVVIDTRNEYEVALGSFAGAIDPHTRSFRDFPTWFRQHRTEWEAEGRSPKVAMFCTGGIRCEKATAFLKGEGVDQVFHLKGGILAYLEQVPPEQSRWEGECFVFDERVTVTHGLQPGTRRLCRDCNMPIDADHQGERCPSCA
jgi:UPF0176 protein